MKPSILLLVSLTAAFTSCTTAYKTGQTPDDVYFSPARQQDEYVTAEKKDDVRYYQGSEDYYTDRYIRMRMQDRYRWSALDDYYFNNAYAYNSYGYYNNWSSPWNSYWAWNSYCNPYYNSGVIIKNPTRFEPPSRAVVFNPNSYINNVPVTNGEKNVNGSSFNRYSSGAGRSSSGAGVYRYNNSNGSSSGNSKSYSNSSSSNSSSNSSTPSSSTPSRSYTPSSSSSSSSSSGSSSGSSGGSRPPR